MNHGYLWAVTSDGTPQRISSKEKPEANDIYDWEDFPVTGAGGEQVHILKVAATPGVIFGIDRAGQIYVFVLQTHLAIRQVVSTYSNQRWYPFVGWSSRTLPTDRPMFSNEDGSKRLTFESFSLRSDGWRWEEPWMVGQDVRRYDKEGWEYAFNFGSGVDYQPVQKKLSMVRRRLFKRTMRYVAIEHWIQMAVTSQEHTFLDICAGNFASGSEGCFDLYALSEAASVYRREGICRNNPEGTRWAKIEGIYGKDGEPEDISAIGTSPAHRCLLALTWDGRLYSRDGMKSDSPTGKLWIEISLPASLPITGFALGAKSLWIVSVEGKIFTTTISLSSNSVAPDYAKLREAGEAMCRMSCTVNDQVLAISNRDEKLHVRSGVCPDEPYGEQWLPVVHRAAETRVLQVDASAVSFTHKRLPKSWIDPNFAPSSLDIARIRDAPWRLEILMRLKMAEERCMGVFQESTDGPEHSAPERNGMEWTKEAKITAILASTGLLNWSEGTLQMNDAEIHVTLKRGTVFRRAMEDISSVYPLSGKSRSVFCIQPRPLSAESIVLIGLGTDDERDQWVQMIEKEIRRSAVLLPRDRRSQWAFSLLSDGTIRCHIISQMRADKNNTQVPVPLSAAPALLVPGHFHRISAGAERIVWAVTKGGYAYALDAKYDPLDEEAEYFYRQYDAELETIVEYQKHALFRGFIPFEGKTGGVYAWSDLDGRHKEKTMKLARGWTWSDPEWRMVADWDYGTALDGKWGIDEKKGNARRRYWQRERAFETAGPWIRVDAPAAASVHVSMDHISPLVWLVTKSGEVLVRLGCTRLLPQGIEWTHLPSEWPIELLCISSPSRVWAVTKCHRLLLRECANPADIHKIDWREVVIEEISLDNVIEIAACAKVLWMLRVDGSMVGILAQKGHYLLYHIRNELPVHGLTVDRDGTLWAIGKAAVYRKSGTIKEVRFSRPLEFEVPWEKVDLEDLISFTSY